MHTEKRFKEGMLRERQAYRNETLSNRDKKDKKDSALAGWRKVGTGKKHLL